ncbi:MAG: DinB family protein [Flavobacteriales bacterium]|nr:DinB family protein [Flavobacteriales bacterium]
MSEHPFDEYFKYYISKVEHLSLAEAFEQSIEEMTSILHKVESQDKWNYSYAEGKWTVGQLLMHIMDTDRIMGYRALSISRGESLNLPGYDHESYAVHANHMEYSTSKFRPEYLANRESLRIMFSHFSNELLNRSGTFGGRTLNVEGLGYLLSGHQKHHVEVLNDRYL